MYNEKAYLLGANRSVIRDLFEYGRTRASLVGEDKIFDYSLGNPSIPSPREVDAAIAQILADTDTLLVHGYTSAVGDLETRQAISQELNQRYGIETKAEEFFLGCGAAPELVSVLKARRSPAVRCWQLPRISRSTSPLPWVPGWILKWFPRTYPPSKST